MGADHVDFLVGESVRQIWIWGPLRLVFDERDPEAYATFEGPTSLTTAGTTVPVNSFPDGDSKRAGDVLELLWKKVESAHIENGSLCLRFEHGAILRGDPWDEGESWEVVGGGKTLICLPGGGLAFTEGSAGLADQ